MSDKTQQIIETAKPILIRYGITRAQLFGSTARGESKPDSDVDILVEFPPQAGLFMVGKLYGDLKDALGKNIDLVSYKAVHPYIEKYVYSSTINII